jgi:catechol 2,3-dioxygenase-like lactoylglutathione lyase family enzyme
MDMKLEVLLIPVSDVDRAKRFYEKLGFRLDIDYAANEDFRGIQFTPPGSEASIIFGKGITSALTCLEYTVYIIKELLLQYL